MLTSNDYTKISQLIDQNTGNQINSSFPIVHELIADGKASIDQLIQSSERQIEISNGVIETEESYEQQTRDGLVEITPQNAEEYLVQGMYLLAASLAYKVLLEESFLDSISPATLKDSVRNLIKKLSLENKKLLGKEDYLDQNEPEVSVTNLIYNSEKMVDALYDELSKNKKSLIDYLNKEYELGKYITKFKNEKSLKSFTSIIQDESHIYFVRHVIEEIVEIANKYKNIDAYLNALLIHDVVAYYSYYEKDESPIDTSNNNEGAIILPNKNALLYEVHRGAFHQSYVHKKLLMVSLLLASKNQLKKISDVGFSIKHDLVYTVYTNFISSFFTQEKLSLTQIEQMLAGAYTETKDIIKDFLLIKQKQEAKEELNPGKIYNNPENIILKGW